MHQTSTVQLITVKKMLEAYKAEKADRLILLGDLLYHGPRNDLPKDYAPKEVIAMLNEHRDDLYVVRGNCDAEVDQMVLHFPIMADYCIIMDGERTIYASHGHVYHEENLPPLKNGDIFIHGHTTCAACGKERKLYHSESGFCFHSQGRKYSHLCGTGGRSVLNPRI